MCAAEWATWLAECNEAWPHLRSEERALLNDLSARWCQVWDHGQTIAFQQEQPRARADDDDWDDWSSRDPSDAEEVNGGWGSDVGSDAYSDHSSDAYSDAYFD
jgi:hypothetical protein